MRGLRKNPEHSMQRMALGSFGFDFVECVHYVFKIIFAGIILLY